MSELVGPARPQDGGSQSISGLEPVPPINRGGAMTPKQIMERRRQREREAEQRLEMEREQEEDRRRAEERRISAERRTAAAGVATSGGATGGDNRRGSGGARRSGDAAAAAQDTRWSGEQTRAGSSAQAPRYTNAPNVQTPATANLSPQVVTRNRAAITAQQQSQAPTPRVGTQTFNTQQPPQARVDQMQGAASVTPSVQRIPNSQSAGTRPITTTASSFPHAFERWETLSSHWEGLTGYWIKRLQNNSDELSGQPLNQQLARQVTDLSAAGANLFHAVVELQRLRASSERKFQRWFFETRSDQERSAERIAQLETQLQSERDARAQESAGGARVEAERASAEELQRVKLQALQADQMVKEMRRELQISRDEARRGWEEIGRMEQAERDRTFSLKQGQPTLVGGVQVVPLGQSPMSRQSTNRPSTREGGLSSHPVLPEESRAEYERPPSATDTDPFTESGRDRERDVANAAIGRIPGLMSGGGGGSSYQPSHTSSAALAQTTSPRPTTSHGPHASTTSATYLPRTSPTVGSTGFYQHPSTSTALHAGSPVPPAEDTRSYGTSEDEYAYDEQGNIQRDAIGRPILYRQQQQQRHRERGREESGDESDDFDVREAEERERAYAQAFNEAQAATAQLRAGASVPSTPNRGGGRSEQQLVSPISPPGGGGAGYVIGSGLGGGGTSGREPDYSGQGYGGWEYGRHHHPTRLSDVMEVLDEDERSRGGESRASMRSRGHR